MKEVSSGRKLHLTSENHKFVKELVEHKYINSTGEGFLIGVSIALKKSLNHKQINIPRSSKEEHTVLEDEKSFNQIEDLTALLNALYPEKYEDIENLNASNKLLSVLADSGLDYLRDKSLDDKKIKRENFFEAINI
tara:strand:+ start:259 stop:666 length:408 start_codon:yes stop_codon:yes gene_type:complete